MAESVWTDAQVESIPRLHDAVLHAMVELGLIQAVFSSGSEASQTWLIWAASATDAAAIVAETPLAQAKLIDPGFEVRLLEPVLVGSRLAKTLRPPARGRFYEWLTTGTHREELHQVLNDPHLSPVELIFASYMSWNWYKQGRLVLMMEVEPAFVLRLKDTILSLYAAIEQERRAQASYDEAQRRVNQGYAWFIEHGIDYDKMMKVWEREGSPEWDTLPEEWWKNPEFRLDRHAADSEE